MPVKALSRVAQAHPRLYRVLLAAASAWTLLLLVIIVWGIHLHRTTLPPEQPLPWTFFRNLIGVVTLVWAIGLGGMALVGRLAGRYLDERFRFQQQLQEANRELRAEREVFLGGAVVVFRWRDAKGWPVEYVSPNVSNLLGYTAEDFLTGRVLYGDIVHPADLAVIANDDPAENEPGPARHQQKTYRLLTRDGGTVWVVENTTMQRDERGEITHWVGYLVNVTSLKKAEQALRKSEQRLGLVVEGAELGLWDWDVPSGHVTLNKQWAAMLGYELEEIEPTLEAWSELVHPDDQPRVMGALREHLEGRTPHFMVEQRLRTKDGGWKWVLDRGRVVERDSEGHPLRATGVHQDINELKNLEQTTVRHERLAAVGQLAAGVAHDFNNLLTGVLGFSELVLENPGLDEVARGHVRRIREASLRGAKLVRQIMDFSQKTLRKPEPLDLCEFLKGNREFFRSLMPEHIELKMDCPEKNGAGKDSAGRDSEDRDSGGKGLVVETDAAQLQQVLTNLATNAMLAMPGGGTLSVTLQRAEVAPGLKCSACDEDMAGTWALLEVADTGVGIPEQIQAMVFEPFFTTRDVGEGSGLGLSQTVGIVGQNQGHLRLESTEGVGTSVKIYLPLSAATAAAPRQAGPPRRGDGQTILLVEDQQDVREATAGLLEGLGYAVTAVERSRRALDLFLTAPDAFDLVLTDMVMPEMSGLVMLGEMRQARPELKAIIMTGYPEVEIDKQVKLQGRGSGGGGGGDGGGSGGGSGGGDGDGEDRDLVWLAKPVGVEELSKAVAKVLGGE